MKVFAVSGYKNSGKTTLCQKLLIDLMGSGLKVGYLKRTHESVMPSADSDTGSIALKGVPALLAGSDGVRFEDVLSEEASPVGLARRYFPDADVVLVEGGKNLPLPKIWVINNGEDPPALPGIWAIYDREGKTSAKKEHSCFISGQEGDLADRIAAGVVKGYRSACVCVGQKELPLKSFIADFISRSVRGMLSSLKDGDAQDKDVMIYLPRGDK